MKFEIIFDGAKLVSDDGSMWFAADKSDATHEGLARVVNSRFDTDGHHRSPREVLDGFGERVEILKCPAVDVGDVVS